MRKRMLMVGAVIIAILLVGCDRYNGRRPYDYGPAKWSSENPEIVFYTSPETGCHPEGTLWIDEVEIPIVVYFDYSNGVEICKKDEGYHLVLRGICTFAPDKLVVEVTGGKEFKDQYEEIVFKRTVE